jgi:hypothetical protein
MQNNRWKTVGDQLPKKKSHWFKGQLKYLTNIRKGLTIEQKYNQCWKCLGILSLHGYHPTLNCLGGYHEAMIQLHLKEARTKLKLRQPVLATVSFSDSKFSVRSQFFLMGLICMGLCTVQWYGWISSWYLPYNLTNFTVKNVSQKIGRTLLVVH